MVSLQPLEVVRPPLLKSVFALQSQFHSSKIRSLAVPTLLPFFTTFSSRPGAKVREKSCGEMVEGGGECFPPLGVVALGGVPHVSGARCVEVCFSTTSMVVYEFGRVVHWSNLVLFLT